MIFKAFLLATALLLTAFDLFRFGWKYLPFSKQELVFPATPVIEFLQEQPRPFRVEFGESIPQNMWLPYGLESAAGYDAMAPLRYSQFLGALRTGQADTPYGRVAQVENYESPLFDLANIKYVLAVKYDKRGIRSPEGKPRPIFENEKFKLVFEDKTVQVYENLEVLPRAFWVNDYEVIRSDQEIINRLISPDYDLKRKVILEKRPDLVSIENSNSQGQIDWLEYRPGKIVLRTYSEKPGLIFLANNFYPGWRAFIDDQETELYRANYTFSAVQVPKGKHTLEFIYQPQSVKIGQGLSLGALASLVIVGIGIYRFRKE
jgi:hypothetical protein